MSLSFLEATKIASIKNDLKLKSFTLATSGQTEKLEVFIKANCILKGFNCQYTTLPFNTLQQYISTPQDYSAKHVFILFPWDILPETDWRTGMTPNNLTLESATNKINVFIKRLSLFTSKSIIYIPARMLPSTDDFNQNQQIEYQIILSLVKIKATILEQDNFSLSSYLSNGCPFSSKKLSNISLEISLLISKSHSTPKKILITDFDNVMWNGVIGEDGIDGIQCHPEGAGYVHYIYQSLLLKLKSHGILIAGVTRNDEELAESPFEQEKTLFKSNDFIAIIASYHAKSAQIKELLKELNLPEDSAVFVDDNPIEIEEVKSTLPSITCLPFPNKNEAFIKLVEQIQKCFNLTNITDDDHNRTELYKTRYQSSSENIEDGADLTDYLTSLEMNILIQKCDSSNYQRSLQLINKTNQFNLNGLRLTDSELIELLKQKNTLYAFSLKDKFGDHGQIASIILSNDNVILYFSMSCRVFQRNIEYAIIQWIIVSNKITNLKLNFSKTSTNIPFQMMIDSKLYSTSKAHEYVQLNTSGFVSEYSEILKIFKIKVENE